MSEIEVSIAHKYDNGAHIPGQWQATKSRVTPCHKCSGIIDDYDQNGIGHVYNCYVTVWCYNYWTL